MNALRLASVLTLLVAPVLAAGCAQTEDAVDAQEGAASSRQSLEFTAAVGAVVVDGRKVCTAALVDVEAEATLGNASLSGRQIVLGGACIGKFANGIGGAVFVTQANGISLHTPILAIDATSQASAGIAVGILSERPGDVKPMKAFTGFSAAVSAGVKTATILEADERGLLIGASAEVRVGVEFNLQTTCTAWHFKAQAEVGVGASLSAGEVFGAAAVIKVDGELQFAASIDGQCVARQIKRGLRLPIDAANSVGDALGSIGAGDTLGVYEVANKGKTTLDVHFYENARELRVNGRGRVSAEVAGASCDALLGACKLAPAGGFAAGTTVSVVVDTHNNLFPDTNDTTKVIFSTKK